MASYLVQQAEEKINAMLEPLQKQAQVREEERLAGEFFKQNEDLKPYETLVRAVVDQLKQAGYDPKDETEAFQEVSKKTREMLKSLGVDTASRATAVPPNTSGKMPRLPAGGQGSAGGGSRASKGIGIPGMEVFE
jgi:hypothetical protein